MKRVFKIGEVVWFSDDHECGWGKVGLINRSDKYKDYPCADESEDILTIIKEGCKSEIECLPSNVYQVAQDKTFRGEPVVYEHNVEIDYPFYCPAEDANCYYLELDDPEPSLADVFDKNAKAVRDKREEERQKLIRMDAEEREYINALAEKLDFLHERGFTLKKYFGGIVDGWPYNYLTIKKGGRWQGVEIEGSSVRRKSGLNVSAFCFANYQHPTLEEVIKVIAEW